MRAWILDLSDINCQTCGLEFEVEIRARRGFTTRANSSSLLVAASRSC